jgi:hypothetical protein
MWQFMSKKSLRWRNTSKPLEATKPLDPCMRRAIHGPIQPMDEPTIFDRLIGR